MKGSKRPFFLYHATRGCHFDNYPSDEWAGKSMARTVYSDCMVQMDYMLGQLVDKLQQIGELENTLIILTSDNGPECEVPPHGRTPFRGCKGSSWEGGVRVPTFAYWKGMIKPRRSDGLFDFADILPTHSRSRASLGRNLPTYSPRRPTSMVSTKLRSCRGQRPVGSPQPSLHLEPILRLDASGRVQIYLDSGNREWSQSKRVTGVASVGRSSPTLAA